MKKRERGGLFIFVADSDITVFLRSFDTSEIGT